MVGEEGLLLLFPSQPGAKSPAPGRPILVEAEFLGHGFAGFRERGAGSFLSYLSQRGQVAADGEDDGPGAGKAGEGVMLHA